MGRERTREKGRKRSGVYLPSVEDRRSTAIDRDRDRHATMAATGEAQAASDVDYYIGRSSFLATTEASSLQIDAVRKRSSIFPRIFLFEIRQQNGRGLSTGRLGKTQKRHRRHGRENQRAKAGIAD